MDASFRYNSGTILGGSGTIVYQQAQDDVHFDAWYGKKSVALLFGPRLTAREIFGRFSPFVYGLVGLSNDRLTGSYDVRGYDDFWMGASSNQEDDSRTIKSHNAAGFALGGGLDVKVMNNWAVRAQTDYFVASHPKYIGNAKNIGNKQYGSVNFSIGLVYSFGR